MKIKLTNLHAYNWSEFTTSIAICGQTADARYHVWMDRDTLKLHDDILHKNSPIESTQHEYRALHQSAQCNRDIVKQLLDAAPAVILQAALDFDKEQERARLQSEERKRKQRIKDTAEDLLIALKNLYAMVEGESPSLLEDDINAENALKAIAKAEGK